MNLELRITLTPIEQRYVATCYPLPDQPNHDIVIYWKAKLTLSARANMPFAAHIKNLTQPFPDLARLVKDGFLTSRSVQSYFEGLDEASHNARLYTFATNAMKNSIPQHILESMLSHVRNCMTTVGHGGLITSPFGECQEQVDQETFGITGEYLLLHGKSKKGHVAIRAISEEDYTAFQQYFVRHKALQKK